MQTVLQSNPLRLCRLCASHICIIDGCVKMSLQANIFTYGIIYTESIAKQSFAAVPLMCFAHLHY